MPTIPVIQQARPQASRAGLRSPNTQGIPNAGSILSEAVKEVGQTQEKVGQAIFSTWQNIKNERDITIAHDNLYKFQDEARTKYSELRSRTGGNAVGITDEFKTWYDEKSKQYVEGMSGQLQIRTFSDAVMSRRERDLNSLAGYEAKEHTLYKQSTFESTRSNAYLDASLYADDPERVELLINDVHAWRDAAFPGLDNTPGKQQDAMGLMSVAIESLTDRDPVKAKALLEQWRPKLGEQAIKISKDVDKEFMYFDAKTKFPGKFNTQYDYIVKVKNVDEDVKRAVLGRINADEAEYESREREFLGNHSKQLKENNLQAWIDWRTGKLSVNGLNDLARKRKIDTTTYNGIYNAMRNPSIENNPQVVGDIAEKLSLGQDIEQDLTNAVNSGQIKPETYISMRANSAKKGMGRAYKYLEALKPPPNLYIPDKQIRYAEAVDSFNRRVASGEDPLKVAHEIVGENTTETRRTFRGLITPRYLDGTKEQLKDPNKINDVMLKTAAAYARGEISTEDYMMEMRNIENYSRIANDQEQAESIDADISKELERQLKNNR